MATAYGPYALIDEARRRARRRRWTYAGVLVLLVGAGIWGGLTLTSRSGSASPAPPAPPGYHLVRARGTVQHVLVRGFSRPLETGDIAGKVAKLHAQVWFDRQISLIRARGCWANHCSAPAASRCTSVCQTSDSFGTLFYPYWPVDTTRFVRRPGLGTFHGREVIWLGKIQETFAPGYRDGTWIALDPRTHDAVAWRLYGTTTKPAGPVLDEFWVARRFPDIAPNRFWFVLRNKPVIKGFVRLLAHPLVVPAGSVTPRDLRAAPRLVGGIGGATIFAAPTRTGYWQMFSVDKHGRVGGGPSQVSEPHAIGVVQIGRGSLFSSRAYLVVAGSTLEQRGAKLFLVYAHGSRERIKPILLGKPVRAGFYYYVIPKPHRIRVGRPTALELVRGSRLVARQPLPMPYQGPEQPGELQVRVAQQVLRHLVPPNHG
jgi:hypothetical protein